MKFNADAASISDLQALEDAPPGFIDEETLRINHEYLRTNSLLRHDEYKAMDQTVIQVARERLRILDDLRSAGLIRDLGTLGVLVDQWESSGDMTDAQIDMDGITPGNEDLPAFTLDGVPIPIIHKGFRVSIRHLQASRRIGAPIDQTGVQVATRKVSEAIERMIFSGTDRVRIGNNRIYGLLTHPDRHAGSFGVGNWDAPGTTGQDILDDVLDMIADAEAANYYGPFILYVPKLYMQVLRQDFKAASDKTILQRILDLSEIQAVRVADSMPANNVLLVQLTSDVIDVSIGQDISVIDWGSKGGLLQHFKVLSALAPRVKSDYAGQSGIVHYS